MCPQEVLFKNVQGTFIQRSPKLERGQVPINRRMGELWGSQSSDGAALGAKEAQTPATRDNVDGSQKHCAE